MSDKPKPSIPPPAPAPWSRPRDDQPTTEMRAGADGIADSVSTSEFSAATEPVTEKIDRDEVNAVRADGGRVIDRRNRVVPSPPEPEDAMPIPLENVKTDVMVDPPDFAEEFREGKRAVEKPVAVQGLPAAREAIAPSRGSNADLTKIVVAIAVVAVGLAAWVTFFLHR